MFLSLHPYTEVFRQGFSSTFIPKLAKDLMKVGASGSAEFTNQVEAFATFVSLGLMNVEMATKLMITMFKAGMCNQGL